MTKHYTINVEVNSINLDKKLNRLMSSDTKNKVLADIGGTISNRIKLCFKQQKSPWGSPWDQLKIRKGEPLRDTGRLLNSITYNVNSEYVSIGTNLVYAALQQFGGVIKPKAKKVLAFKGANGTMIFAKRAVIPARSFMPLHRFGDSPDIPPEWLSAVKKSAREVVIKSFEG